MERRPLVIIGSGPAGSATALYLQAAHPALARETLILEQACHPRPKVCAGGLIPHTLACLEELGLPLAVPNVAVRRTRVHVPGARVHQEADEMCRVVRRDVFDHDLVRACRARGVEVHEREKVLRLERVDGAVLVETDRTTYHARVVVGADGSGSRVRRALVPGGRDCVGKAVMTDVPVRDTTWDGYAADRYDFDFRDVPDGLRGYAWVFPCVIDGVPHANVGAYAVDAAGSGAVVHRVLRRLAAEIGAGPAPVKAFPIRWYGRGVRIAAPHVLLVGDAAGVDPLMGEGISFAFEYGRRAAAAAGRALGTGDYDFAAYERAVADSWMGRKLRRLELGARLFYGPTWRLWFALAARSRFVQQMGVRWYNGVDGWDQRSAWDAIRYWLRGAAGPRDPDPARA